MNNTNVEEMSSQQGNSQPSGSSAAAKQSTATEYETTAFQKAVAKMTLAEFETRTNIKTIPFRTSTPRRIREMFQFVRDPHKFHHWQKSELAQLDWHPSVYERVAEVCFYVVPFGRYIK